MRGEVIDFDDAAGIGTVRDEETGATHAFHCTQIVDGSRTIAVGTRVAYEVRAGHLGTWEAVRLTPATA